MKIDAQFLIAVGLCLIVGCAGYNSRKMYSSPHGNFDSPIPDTGMFTYEPARIQEDSDDIGGRVVFYDDLFFNIRRSVTYRRLPAGSDTALRDAAEREAAVRGFFHEYVLPELFMPVSPYTEILTEEIIGTGDAVEFFAVVRIPGGSILTDGTCKRLDSIRALLIFPHGRYMYMLGFDNMTLRAMMAAPPESATVVDLVDYHGRSGKAAAQRRDDDDDCDLKFRAFVEMARQQLSEFRSTIRFK